MLLQAPASMEPRYPRRRSLATAAGLLTLAVLVSGVGLAARAAPVPVRKDPPRKTEPGKEEPKKETEQDDLSAVLESVLKRLPPGTNPATVEQIRPQMRRFLLNFPADQLRGMREELERGGLPGVAPFAPLGGPAGGMLPGGLMATRANVRLGVRVEAPGATLAEQLDLPREQGLVLREVLPNSAAARAGLKPHDILLEVNGKPVPDRPDGLVKLLADIKADAMVEAVVLRRGNKEVIKELTLPEARRPAGLPGGFGPGVPGGFSLPQTIPPAPPGALGGSPPAVAGRGVMMTLFRTQDRFTLRHQEGSLVITLTGKSADGKARVHDIQVQDGGRSDSYPSADKVPEAYRDKVRNLIELSEKSSVRVEIPTP